MNKIEESKIRNRKNRIFFLYRDYLLVDILNDSEESIHGEEYNFSEKQKDFIRNILYRKEELEKVIFPFLPSDWKWERFNNMEKAVILNSAAEILMTETKKEVVINEAIEYSKKYCDERAQPLLNAIIDKIVKTDKNIVNITKKKSKLSNKENEVIELKDN